MPSILSRSNRIHFCIKMPAFYCENIDLRNIFVAEVSHLELLFSGCLASTAKEIEIVTEHDFVRAATKGA